MELIDTHCHIQSIEAENGERTTLELWSKADGLSARGVLENAAEAGVGKMVCVGCDLEDSKLAVDFVKTRENCYASIGIHPHEAQHYAGRQELLQEFSSLVDSKKVVAIGECGFDFYYNHSPKEAQIELLKFQLELAQKHNLPLIFHVREAFDDFWPVFDSYKGLRGVLHSFTDSRQNLDKAIERGLSVGVNGIATFAKNPEQLEVYRTMPLKNLVLETDAPFLTPTPYRGSINEPKNVRVVAEFVAELRGESLDALAAATTHNAHELFGLN